MKSGDTEKERDVSEVMKSRLTIERGLHKGKKRSSTSWKQNLSTGDFEKSLKTQMQLDDFFVANDCLALETPRVRKQKCRIFFVG